MWRRGNKKLGTPEGKMKLRQLRLRKLLMDSGNAHSRLGDDLWAAPPVEVAAQWDKWANPSFVNQIRMSDSIFLRKCEAQFNKLVNVY